MPTRTLTGEEYLAYVASQWWVWFDQLDGYASPWELMAGIFVGAVTVEYAQAYLALHDLELPNVEYPTTQKRLT